MTDQSTKATAHYVSGDLYFEDFAPGQRFLSPALTMTESAIIEFALGYDPQPFHISRTDAEQHPFGQLFASGIHTFSVLFRLFWESRLLARCAYAGAGIDNMRWLKPVFPGDTLHGEFEVLSVTPSRSKPEIGALVLRHQAVNQHGDTVLALDCTHLIKRRHGAADETVEV